MSRKRVLTAVAGIVCTTSVCKLPLYVFKSEQDCCPKGCAWRWEKTSHPLLFLDLLLPREWEKCMPRGLFRYDVIACETKGSSGAGNGIEVTKYGHGRGSSNRIFQCGEVNTLNNANGYPFRSYVI